MRKQKLESLWVGVEDWRRTSPSISNAQNTGDAHPLLPGFRCLLLQKIQAWQILTPYQLCARDCPGIAVPAFTLIRAFYSSSLQQVYHSLCPTNLLTHPNPCSQKAVCYVKENEAIRTLCLSPLPKSCILNPCLASLLCCLLFISFSSTLLLY